MSHYVIVFDYMLDGMEGNVIILGVAHTLDKAKEIFNENVESEKEYAAENNYEIYNDTDTDFDAGENGRWCENHTHLWIQGVL